jgi:short-subunit dehydrogenase involved in D-alanine esterification of teichoic acids
VLICGRTQATLRRAQARVPGLAYLRADVIDAADRHRLLTWVEAVDQGEIAVNLAAPIRRTSLFLPHLRRQAERGPAP